MKKLSVVPKLALAALLAAGALAAPSLEAGRLPGPPILCPAIYQPVICSDGVVYSNSCEADAAGATGCVPYAIIF